MASHVSNQIYRNKKAFISTPQSTDRSRPRQEPLGEIRERICTDNRPVLSPNKFDVPRPGKSESGKIKNKNQSSMDTRMHHGDLE